MPKPDEPTEIQTFPGLGVGEGDVGGDGLGLGLGLELGVGEGDVGGGGLAVELGEGDEGLAVEVVAIIATPMLALDA